MLRKLADAGLAVILVEHDMTLVMGISDHVVVLDAGRPIAAGRAGGRPQRRQGREAYLGSGKMQVRPRAVPLPAGTAAAARRGRARAPATAPCRCCDGITFEVRQGELVALLGANGAGKSTTMRALSGLLRPVSGTIRLAGDAHRAAGRAPRLPQPDWSLVPEGRQVFPELSVRDNLLLGAHARKAATLDGDIEALAALASRGCASACTARAGLAVGRRAADAGASPAA